MLYEVITNYIRHTEKFSLMEEKILIIETKSKKFFKTMVFRINLVGTGVCYIISFLRRKKGRRNTGSLHTIQKRNRKRFSETPGSAGTSHARSSAKALPC